MLKKTAAPELLEPAAADPRARHPRNVHELKSLLEKMILDGEFEVGSRLNENALSVQLGVSRATVREAVRIMETNGLVETVRNRGAIVRNVDLARIVQLYDVRAGLNRVAGRLLAAQVTKEQLEDLTSLHRIMAELVDTQNTNEYHEVNMRFHNHLMAYSGNAVLSEFDTVIENQCRIFFKQGVFGPVRLRISHIEHTAMLDAVVAGDVERAADAFERHILNGKLRMLESIGSRRPAWADAEPIASRI